MLFNVTDTYLKFWHRLETENEALVTYENFHTFFSLKEKNQEFFMASSTQKTPKLSTVKENDVR